METHTNIYTHIYVYIYTYMDTDTYPWMFIFLVVNLYFSFQFNIYPKCCFREYYSFQCYSVIFPNTGLKWQMIEAFVLTFKNCGICKTCLTISFLHSSHWTERMDLNSVTAGPIECSGNHTVQFPVAIHNKLADFSSVIFEAYYWN